MIKLKVSHRCWEGGRALFIAFRRELAKQIGVDLDEYLGYNKSGTKNLEDIKHDLHPLFNLIDCNGELTVFETKQIARGLDNVLDIMNEDNVKYYRFKEKVIQFRNGCLDAIYKNEKIVFCVTS